MRSEADPHPTPGQKIAQQQAKTLQKEKFEAHYGADTVAKWNIAWGVFSENPDNPFTPAKRQNIKKLLNIMLKNNITDDLFGTVAGIKARMEGVHLTRLEQIMEDYFRHRYPHAREILFNTKSGGDQMGATATIELDENNRLKFFIKTHSKGKKASLSTAAKLLDSKELLVYKILENLGLGCQAFFCTRSPEDVYITTLDAAQDGPFSIFDKFAKSDDTFGISLWGTLDTIQRPYSNNDWDTIEQNLQKDPIARSFADKMATVDILTRILRLHDLLNNSDNYGFVQTPQKDNPWALRVIDFRLSPDDDLYFTDDKWRGFLAGNGMFNYAGSHKTVAYLLHHRHKNFRVNTAKSIMASTLRTFESAVGGAYEFVLSFINEEPVFNEKKAELVGMLTSYHDIILQNITTFRKKLHGYIPETDEA